MNPGRCALAIAALLFAAVTGPARAGDEAAPIAGARDSDVTVRVLTKDHPRRLVLRGGPGAGSRAVVGTFAVGDLDDGPGAARAFPRARWTLEIPGAPGAPRATRATYDAALELRAEDGEIAVVARFDLEDYVARVVSAETDASAPRAALEALAVVVRSIARASAPGSRHEDATFCDLAHCQVLSRKPPRANARQAADATRGRVLRLQNGAIAAPVFHGSCGGATAEPSRVFGRADDRSGAASVEDPACAADTWRARLPRALVQGALASALAGARWDAIEFIRDRHGRALEVVDRASGRRAPADALVRAIDRAAGWGTLRSAMLDARARGTFVVFEGRGLGHGVGLCQRGAARMAARGADATAILAHYFPLAR